MNLDAAATSSTNNHDDKILDAIAKVSSQLDAFNLHYLTKLEDKFVNIMQTMGNLDANIKQLQEKAQVWDIFRHHITSWSEHIKSSDNKIEILKRSLENLPVIENQLQNTDFKVQHVFEKADVINEKLNDITKSMLEMRRAPIIKQRNKAAGPRSWSQEDFEQTEILMRLSKIQRTLQSTCSSMRVGKEIEGFKPSKPLSPSGDDEVEDDESMSMKTLMLKVNSNIEKIPIREIRQSFSLNKKHEKALEAITSSLNLVDERTIRIFDTNSYQFKKLLSCCKSTEHEILTFTNNANTLLKRTEKALKEVEASTVVSKNESSTLQPDQQFDGSGEEIDEETLDETGKKRMKEFPIKKKENSSSLLSCNFHITTPSSNLILPLFSFLFLFHFYFPREYIQPKKTNCFQLTTGRSGVYTFGSQRELNEKGKDFNQQYCEYSTEGTAWTIIQKRDNFNPPENFNRSWSDYKHGFGNLQRDFWFGNDYIHK